MTCSGTLAHVARNEGEPGSEPPALGFIDYCRLPNLLHHSCHKWWCCCQLIHNSRHQNGYHNILQQHSNLSALCLVGTSFVFLLNTTPFDILLWPFLCWRHLKDSHFMMTGDKMSVKGCCGYFKNLKFKIQIYPSQKQNKYLTLWSVTHSIYKWVCVCFALQF